MCEYVGFEAVDLPKSHGIAETRPHSFSPHRAATRTERAPRCDDRAVGCTKPSGAASAREGDISARAAPGLRAALRDAVCVHGARTRPHWAAYGRGRVWSHLRNSTPREDVRETRGVRFRGVRPQNTTKSMRMRGEPVHPAPSRRFEPSRRGERRPYTIVAAWGAVARLERPRGAQVRDGTRENA